MLIKVYSQTKAEMIIESSLWEAMSEPKSTYYTLNRNGKSTVHASQQDEAKSKMMILG